ncbi:hypothetical protein JAAARDRAFT_184927 [Jaapia argillacea MUCL 33604]|uniref:BTB domain-containing protein n=1 Tax=Jaapia argillacea MUCL 33604 TaxID=933084 RepID=A0A067P9G2_9AGAM|nr:hypothetical protein JAAARDRAFT_184927 [Jaapia argillacea MUCL 33604]
MNSTDLAPFVRSNIWFPDGNVVLIVDQFAFRVHRGQLERHSEVFRDMFSIPQPSNEDLFEGCICIKLYDSSADLLFLLTALYDGLYFHKPRARDFSAISAVLRLSSKYLIDHLRRHCILRLEQDWPSTLVGWDHREKVAIEPSGRYNPREFYPHPILVIDLARQLSLDFVLPAAFYDLSRYGPSKIASGTLCPATTTITSNGSSATKTIAFLSRQDLLTTFSGREHGQRYISTFISEELSNRPVSASCSNASSPTSPSPSNPCIESFYFIQLNVLRSVGGIAAGRDGDPLYTLLQAIEMLSRTDFSDGETGRQCGLLICGACRKEFETSVGRCRGVVWEELKGWFNLEPEIMAIE